MKREETLLYIEYLSVPVWCRVFFGYIVREYFKREHNFSSIFFIDASKPGLFLAHISGIVFRASPRPKRLEFRLIDIRDDQGILISIRVASQDIAQIQNQVRSDPVFQSFESLKGLDETLRSYVFKSVATVSMTDRETLWRALLLIHACAHSGHSIDPYKEIILFLGRRPWFSIMKRYAKAQGATLIEVPSVWNPRLALQHLITPYGFMVFKMLRNKMHNFLLFLSKPSYQLFRLIFHIRDSAVSPRVMVEHGGHFNLEDAGRYSDLFFWRESELSGKDIVLLFKMAHDPLDRHKWKFLKEHGIEATLTYPGSTALGNTSLFSNVPRMSLEEKIFLYEAKEKLSPNIEGKWIFERIQGYYASVAYWRELFHTYGVKVYVSWYRYDTQHHAIAGALKNLGGIMAIYQRAFQDYPSPAIMTHADIMFGYAPFDAKIERCSGSRIAYHVAVGYLHDYTFFFLRPQAQMVRQKLRAAGAEFIIAYFDGNSNDDARWHTGHEFMRENYKFILEKLLSDSALGLVLKPKYPPSLRKRLGPVVELLEAALKTGRCYIYEYGALHGSYPPAVGALSADLAVHGHLSSATAGFEAASVGTPTLMLDREGWSVSPFYNLGVGRVVFTNWQDLWDALSEYRKQPEGTPGFGEWGDMLNTLDPFRDGKAAQRMGTYLEWIIEGLKRGENRDTVLSDAADRYVKIWGADKITEVRG